jgi:flagellin
MSLVVGTNTSAQFAQDALRANQNKIAIAMERLSTGLRINSARDDAAGLAISQSMTSQIRGLNQAVRNINDGVNLLQTAEGGLGSITDMLQRMRELAVQSANGTNSDAQRAYLQKEAAALQEQISKVVDTTTWNDKKLLDGSFTGQKIQVGADAGANIEINVPSIASTPLPPENSNGTPLPPITSGNPTWTKMVASSGSVYITAMAMGSDGFLYTTGFATGSIDGQNAGQEDFMLSKFDTNGNRIWSKLLGAGIGVDISHAITIGHDGSIYVAGSANGSLTDPTVNTDNIGDILVAKFNAGGVLQWAKQMGTIEDDRATGLASASDGSIYLTGTTTGNLSGTNVASGGSAWSGQGDAFVSKLDESGNLLWTKQQSGSRFGNGIASGPDGSAYAVGAMDSPMNGVSPNGAEDGFINKFNADGSIAWTTKIGTSTTDYADKVAVAVNGDIYVTGSTYGALGSSNLPGNRETYLTKLNPTGTIQWSRQLSLGTYNSPNGITTNANGNIFISGWWPQDGSEQGGSAFVAEYTPDGQKISTDLVAHSYSWATGVVTDSSNALYVGGYSQYGVNGQPFHGPVDSFLLKYSRDSANPDPSNGSSAICVIDISTQTGASSAIGVIDSTLDSVNSTRSNIGSYINRLNYAGDNATNISTNLAASRSTIQDTDYAYESANLAKSQIVQQAATAMLVQANQQPQSVLALLKNL